MEKNSWNFKDFLKTPLGIILAFVVVFYVITFGVYYFYSPGPEERRMGSESQQQSSVMSPTFDVTQQNK